MITQIEFGKNRLSLTLAAVLLAWAMQNAAAGERQRSGSFQGPRGHSGTYSQSIQTASGQRNKQTTVQSGNAWVTRQTSATWDPATKSASRATATTLSNGRSVATSKTVTRTDNGQVTTGSYATSGGRTGSYQIGVASENGTRVKTQSMTTGNGHTLERKVETTAVAGGIHRVVTTQSSH
jgi:hypothetical protein